MSQAMTQKTFRPPLLGRSFVNAPFDYLLIGGGLSLLVTAFLLLNPSYQSIGGETAALPFIILLSNSCHFAASTVRLYTKPGATQALPFLSMMFPLVMFAVLTACMFAPEKLGYSFQALYLTWSPYHYAAQAYGLSVMYSYRSGCVLESGDKKLLWWVSMLPFFYAFFYPGENSGIRWLLQGYWSDLTMSAPHVFDALEYVLLGLAFAAPLLLYFKVRAGKSGAMPLIAILTIVANGVWWFVLAPRNAFTWATIFHGIQYLAIVIIFHVKDQMAIPNRRHGVAYYVVTFYLMCLALGYAIFQCVPRAYMLMGFSHVSSILFVAAAINIHHFIVDAYIWRLKKTDGNRKIVDAGLPATESSPAI